MLKYIFSLLSVVLISSSFCFAAEQSQPARIMPPHRMDLMDGGSKAAQVKLQRAEYLLATLVPDPQSYNLILSSTPSIGAEAVPPHVFSDKPTVIVYEGTIAPARTNEEAAFVLAHELGHINLHHNEHMDQEMNKIFSGPPIGISGTTFSIYKQKLREREADQFGFNLYKQAGYDLNFFPHTLALLKINQNIHYGTKRIFAKPALSLSLKDSHFNMVERFSLLSHEALAV